MSQKTVVAKAEDLELAAGAYASNIRFLYEMARTKRPVIMRGMAVALRQGRALQWLCGSRYQEDREELEKLCIIFVEGKRVDGGCRKVSVAEAFMPHFCPNGLPAPNSGVRNRPSWNEDLEDDVAGFQALAD